MAELDKIGPTCQSCSMPLDDKKDYGTNADGSLSAKYCRYCYGGGKFTEPSLTMEQMIEKVVGIMMIQKVMEEVQVKHIAETIIPQLERWRKAHKK
ncbi:transcriptional regulator [bacterium]|nr:MAG: transcriptional regulator [bacterium]